MDENIEEEQLGFTNPQREIARKKEREQFWNGVLTVVAMVIICLVAVVLLYLFLSWKPILTRTFLGWFNISSMISSITIVVLFIMWLLKGTE